MEIVIGLVTAAVAVIAAVLLVSFVGFYMTCYATDKQKQTKEEYPIPVGEVYEVHRDKIIAGIKFADATPHEAVEVTSFDGLTLRGHYYEYAKGAPIELMMSGYRGDARRDMSGGVKRGFILGHNVLLVDQRACGQSDGHIITFGIREQHDVLTWIKYIVDRFGEDTPILLTGISMGAATMLNVVGRADCPPQVKGVLADCGYTSARDIIKKVIRQIHVPSFMYWFIRAGAAIYGKFDLEETAPFTAVKRCRVPVVFIHGEADDYVPCGMSRMNFAACPAEKRLLTVPGADHGLSYVIAPQEYIQTLTFLNEKIGYTPIENEVTV